MLPMLVLALACTGKGDCADDEVWGETAAGMQCVPAACGEGRWGDAPPRDRVVFVDASTDRKRQQGTERHPYDDISEGVEAALELGSDAVVMLADGTYDDYETQDDWDPDGGWDGYYFDGAIQGLTVRGRCRDMVLVDSFSALHQDGDAAGVFLLGPAAQGTLHVQDLVLYGAGWQPAMMVQSGAVRIRDAVVGGAIDLPVLWAEGADSRIELERVDVLGYREQETRDDQASGHNGFGIFARDGATVTGTDVTIQNQELAVVVSGQGTRLELERFEVFDNVPADTDNVSTGGGVQVTDGAAAVLRDGVFNDNGSHQLYVDTGGSLALDAVAIEGGLPGREDFGVGLMASAGGLLQAKDLEIRAAYAAGVVVQGEESMAEFDGLHIEGVTRDTAGGAGFGLLVLSGAVVEADEAVVTGADNIGLYVEGDGTVLTGHDLHLDGNGDRSLGPSDEGLYLGWGGFLAQGAEVRLIDSTLSDNVGAGLVVFDDRTDVTLEGVEISRTEQAADLRGGRGLEVAYGADVVAEDLLVSGAYAAGILVSGEASTLALTDSIISDVAPDTEQAAAAGVVAQAGGTAELLGTTVGEVAGPGLLVQSKGALSCTDCRVAETGFSGAAALGDGDLLLQGSTLERTGPLGGAGTGGVGLFVGGSDGLPEVVVEDCSLTDNPLAGLWVGAAGSVAVARSTIGGGAGVEDGGRTWHGDAAVAGGGVVDWDGEQGLLLEEVTLRDGRQAGLLLDGARATLVDVAFADNAIDVLQQRCEALAPLDEVSGATSTALCDGTTVGSLVDQLDFSLTLDESAAVEADAPEPEGGTPQL